MNRFMRPSAPYTYPHRGSLEVTKFGVQELNAKEMVKVEGGAIFRAKGFLGWMFGGNSWSDVEIEVFGWQIK